MQEQWGAPMGIKKKLPSEARVKRLIKKKLLKKEKKK